MIHVTTGCVGCAGLGQEEAKEAANINATILIALGIVLVSFGAAWVLSGEAFGIEQVNAVEP